MRVLRAPARLGPKAHLMGCLIVALGVGCASGGPYGYSRTYEPGDGEEDAVESAVPYDPIMVRRRPQDWTSKNVMLFGVVKSRRDGSGGAAYLTLGMRTLSDRNLCESPDEDTCRVTVSEHEHAVVHALVPLGADDDIGKERIGPGSLLRIVGKVTDEVDESDGSRVIRATYYRHWPYREYVTTAARSYMLR
jgi:hypothetical protein